MTQTFRTTDVTRWGSGKGSRLTPTEVDINFWDILVRLVAQEARPDPGPNISFFSVSGTQFYVHMSDATVQGPYDLPQFDFFDKGDWAPSTSYAVNDVFTINGGLYRVRFAHTSALTFDAGANDGAGHDYYRLWFQMPGSSLPTGGAVGQVVTKSTTSDFAVTWTWKFPSGGSARKYLIQQSGTQDDAAWETPQASDVHFTAATGSALTSGTVDDVLEALATMIGGGGGPLSGLSDVLFATGDPVTGQVLTFDGAHWTAETPSSGGTLDGLSDATITSPALGDQLYFDSVWRNRHPTSTDYGSFNGTITIHPLTDRYIVLIPNGNVTFNNAADGITGDQVTVHIITSGTTSFNCSFGGSFWFTQGTLATGTVNNKHWVVTFVQDATSGYLIETSRIGPF